MRLTRRFVLSFRRVLRLEHGSELLPQRSVGAAGEDGGGGGGLGVRRHRGGKVVVVLGGAGEASNAEGFI